MLVQHYPSPPSQGQAPRGIDDEGSYFVGKLALITNLSSSITMPEKSRTTTRDLPGRRSPFRSDVLPQTLSGSPLRRGRSISSVHQQAATLEMPLGAPQRCFSVAAMHTVDFVDMFGEPCMPDVSSTIVFLVTPSQTAPYRLVSPSAPSRSLGASPPSFSAMAAPISGTSSRPYIIYRSWTELSALDDRLQSTFDMLLSVPRRNTLARLSAELSPSGKLRAKSLRVLKSAAFLSKSSALPASKDSRADGFRRKLDECWSELLLTGGEVIASSRAMQSFCHKRSTDDRMSMPAESLAPSDDPFKAPPPVHLDFLQPLRSQRGGAVTPASVHECREQENVEPSSCFEEEILEPLSYREIPRRRGSNMFDRFRRRASEQQELDAMSDSSSQSIRSSSSVRSLRSIRSFASSRLSLRRSNESLSKVSATPSTLRSPAEQVRASFVRPRASPHQTSRSSSAGHRPSYSFDARGPESATSNALLSSCGSLPRACEVPLCGSATRDPTTSPVSPHHAAWRASGGSLHYSDSRDSAAVSERPVYGTSRPSSSGASPSGSVFRCSSELDVSSLSSAMSAALPSVSTHSSFEPDANRFSNSVVPALERSRSENLSYPGTRSASPMAIPGPRPSANLSRYSSMRLGSWRASSRPSTSVDVGAYDSPGPRPTRLGSILPPTPGSSESSQDQPDTPMPVATPTDVPSTAEPCIHAGPSSLERMIFGVPEAAAGAAFADALTASPTRAPRCLPAADVPHGSQPAPDALAFDGMRSSLISLMSLGSSVAQEDSSTTQMRRDSPTMPCCMSMPQTPDTFLDLPCSSSDSHYGSTMHFDCFGGSRASPRRHSGLAVRISLDFGDADSLAADDSLDADDDEVLPGASVHPYADVANAPFTPPRRAAHPYATL